MIGGQRLAAAQLRLAAVTNFGVTRFEFHRSLSHLPTFHEGHGCGESTAAASPEGEMFAAISDAARMALP